jgi:hypothetical protein
MSRGEREILGTVHPAGAPAAPPVEEESARPLIPLERPAAEGTSVTPEVPWFPARDDLGETPRVVTGAPGEPTRFLGRSTTVVHHALDPAALLAQARFLRGEASRVLEAGPAGRIPNALEPLLEAWRDPGSPERREAESLIPDLTGYSPPVVREGLDRAFDQWTAQGFRRLLERELGGAEALEGWRPLERGGRVIRTRALTPGFVQIVAAGNIPTTPMLAVLHSLLLRSGCMVKVSSRDPISATLFARSIRRRIPTWSGLVSVVYPGGGGSLLPVPAREGAVIGFGSDATVERLEREIPPGVPHSLHGHKLSLGVLLAESLRAERMEDTARRVARDVALFDQQGCLSPLFHLFETPPERRNAHGAPREAFLEELTRAVAGALVRAARELPPRRLDLPTASAVRQWRARAVARRHAGLPCALAFSEPDLSWSVAALGRLEPVAPILPRVVRLLPLPSPEALRRALASAAGALSTLSWAGDRGRLGPWEAVLFGMGISRVVPAGGMQEPSPLWFHDGRANLRPLVRWVDEED